MTLELLRYICPWKILCNPCLIPFILSHPICTLSVNSTRFILKNIQSPATFHHFHSYYCGPSHHYLSPESLQSLLTCLCPSTFDPPSVYQTWPEWSSWNLVRSCSSSAQNPPVVSYFTQNKSQSHYHDLWDPTWFHLLWLFLIQSPPTNAGLHHQSLNTPGTISLCTGCFLCPACTSPRYPHALLPHFFPNLFTLRPSMTPYLKCQHTPPTIPILLSCLIFSPWHFSYYIF